MAGFSLGCAASLAPLRYASVLLAIMALEGCVSQLSLGGEPCPCGEGYFCCVNQNVCVPSGSSCQALSSSGDDDLGNLTTDATFGTLSDRDATASVEEASQVDAGQVDSPQTDIPDESPDAANSTTVTFGERPDADFRMVSADTWLAADKASLNYGAHADLHLETNTVALIRFDVSALPSSATIESAQLLLTTNDRVRSGGTPTAYELLQGWDEGLQDTSAGAANATVRLGDGTPWSAANAGGASRGTFEVARWTMTASAETEFSADLSPALVQKWLSGPPAANYGIVIERGGASLEVHSREALDPSKRPLLVVTYH